MTSIVVLIPCFNRKHLISAAIESVDNQTIKPSLVVILDDGSKDGTKEYVQSLDLPPQYSYVWQTNKGVSEARNTGFEYKDYDYIAFLDSDDSWEPNHLESLAKQLDLDSEIGAVFSNFEFVSSDPKHSVEAFQRAFEKSRQSLLESSFEPSKLNIGALVSTEKLPFEMLKKGFPFRIPGSMLRMSTMYATGIRFDAKIRYTEEAQLFQELSFHTRFGYSENKTLKVLKHPGNLDDFQHRGYMAESFRLRVGRTRQFLSGFQLSSEGQKIASDHLSNMEQEAFAAACFDKQWASKILEAGKLLIRRPNLRSLKTLLKTSLGR